MNRQFVAMILGAASLLAQAAPETSPDAYFSKQNPKLSAKDKAALAIAQKWQSGGGTGMKPIAGPDGSVRFVYGAQQATVVCAVLQLCDVTLQPGELVNNLNVGDPRFMVEPAISGGGANEVQHLIIKPLDVGLDSSLVVTTNRRTYHLRLRSHRNEFMPRVSFTYPDEAAAKWEKARTLATREKNEQTIPQTKEYLGDLSFKYDVSGSAPWKPVRVYNDGVKTIIQMPGAMSQTEAPSLLVVRRDGGLFRDEDTVMVNYRVHGDRYIVDTIFDKAILIAGVGRGQDRITITRGR